MLAPEEGLAMKLRRRPARAPCRAITLVEGLLALLLFSLVMIGMWNLVSTGTRQMAYGTWYSSTIAEIRTGLARLREDLGRASFPSVITPTNVTVQDVDTNGLSYRDGLTNVEGNAGTLPIMSFLICKPKREGFPDAADNRPETKIRVTFEARGNVLYYKKAPEPGTTAAPGDLYDRILIRDVRSINLAVRAAKVGDQLGVVDIEIKTVYPTDKKREVGEKTTAKLAVKYKTL
jgi:hypothetical protein